MKALVSSGDLDRTGDQPILSYLNLNHRVMFFLYLDVCSEKESVEATLYLLARLDSRLVS